MIPLKDQTPHLCSGNKWVEKIISVIDQMVFNIDMIDCAILLENFLKSLAIRAADLRVVLVRKKILAGTLNMFHSIVSQTHLVQ